MSFVPEVPNTSNNRNITLSKDHLRIVPFQSSRNNIKTSPRRKLITKYLSFVEIGHLRERDIPALEHTCKLPLRDITVKSPLAGESTTISSHPD